MAPGVTSTRRSAHALQLTSLAAICVSLVAAAAASTSSSISPAPVGGAKPLPVGVAKPATVGVAKTAPVGVAKPGVGVAVAQPAHAGAHRGAPAGAQASGLDGFQTGMVIGFVTFAVLALCMMLLVLYLLVRGPRRELREARVELAELRRQRRLEAAASDRLQPGGPAAAARGAGELRCMVNDVPDGYSDDEEAEVEDDSCEYLVGDVEVDASKGGYAYAHQRGPPSPAYDNYDYVAMPGTTSSHGRNKKARVIIEN